MSEQYKEGEAPQEKYDEGIVVGRFQTPALHESHKKLFDYVCSRHQRVTCFLGNSPIMGTRRNPLTFDQRKAMIQEDYPNVECFYVHDQKSNEAWVKTLDRMIGDRLHPLEKALLYGSRDSFINTYVNSGGRFDTEELESDSFISATQIRKETSRMKISSHDVRVGMVIASNMRYPTSFTTVDVAIMDDNRTNIWLGRKLNENEFRFIGGFTDPNSETIEDDAKREVLEETHMVVSEPEYLCSMRIEDWRYLNELDKIKTTFWIADRIGGTPEPDDDIHEIRKFPIKDFLYEEGYAPFESPYKVDIMVGEHKKLMVKLLDYLAGK